MSVLGAVLLASTASFGQRFVGISDLNPAGMQSQALGVDDQGEVVGTMWPAAGGDHVPCFSRDGAPFQEVAPGLVFGPGEAVSILAGGPSGTRLVLGNQSPFGFLPVRGFIAVVTTDRNGVDSWGPLQDLSQSIVSGTDNFGLDSTGHPNPGYRYDSTLFDGGGLTGQSRVFAMTQAAKDVVLTTGGPVVDVYYVVGEYEWQPTVTHAALWRVVIPVDSYMSGSGVEVTLYDMHTAGPLIGGARQMQAGSSTARSIMRYSERSRGTVNAFCLVGGSVTTSANPEQGATWLESADMTPDQYQIGPHSTPLGGTASRVNCLYYRRDKDSALRSFIGEFVGGVDGQAGFQPVGGTLLTQGAGSFNCVALTGGDRGDAWAVGQIDGKAQLFNFDANTQSILKNLVPGTVWTSLDEANGVSGKTIVGCGTVGGESHAYRLMLR